MKKIGLALLVLVIGLIPAMANAGGPYERFNGGYEQRRMLPAASYPSVRYDGYVGEGSQAQCRPPDRHERVEAPYYRPCEKSAVRRIKPPVTAKMTQNTTVIFNNYPQKPAVKPVHVPKKVEKRCADPCPNPCFKEVGRLSAEVQQLEKKLSEAQERARTDSAEIRRLTEENGGLWELVRANQSWQSQYREWYREWQAKFK